MPMIAGKNLFRPLTEAAMAAAVRMMLGRPKVRKSFQRKVATVMLIPPGYYKLLRSTL